MRGMHPIDRAQATAQRPAKPGAPDAPEARPVDPAPRPLIPAQGAEPEYDDWFKVEQAGLLCISPLPRCGVR